MRITICLLTLLIGFSALADPLPCIEHDDYLKHVADVRLLPPESEGCFKDLVVKGRKAYAIGSYYLDNDVLQIIDLIDDTAPTMRGQLDLQAYVPCRAITAIDHFVLIGGHNLLVVDVDDHDNPELVFIDLSVTNVWDIVISQGLAYVAHEAGGVQVYDLDIPFSPVPVFSVETPFEPRSLAITDQLLVVGGVNGLAVYSLVDPFNPVFLGTTSLPNTALAVDAEGTLAVAGGWGAHVIDLADPTNPTVKATDFVQDVKSCTLRDGVAWIGRHGSLDRWSVADPTAPVRLGQDFCRGYPVGLAFEHGNVYTANWADDYQWLYEEGFHVYAGQEPASPPGLGLLGLTINYSSHGKSDLLGDLLYVVGETDIDVIDLSDPMVPELVGTEGVLGLYQFGRGAVVADNHLLVHMWSLHPHYYYWDVYDLSDPLQPEFTETTDLGFSVTTMGDLVFGGSADGITVYTMLPTAHLEMQGTIWAGEDIGAPVFSENRGAMYLGNGEVRLAEFSNPLEPTVLGTIPAHDDADYRFPMLYEGDFLTTRLWDVETWEIWDVSDPGTPILQFTHQPDEGNPITSMALHRDLLYVSDRFRIQVWDVSDPNFPIHLGDRGHEVAENSTWLHQRPDYLLRTGYSGYIATLPYQCSSFSSVQDEVASKAPSTLKLQAVPNPFNPRTSLYFDLPDDAEVKLTLYDLRGRRVKRLASGLLGAGGHNIFWDGSNEQGRASAAGVYLARLEAGGRVATTRLVLVR